MPDHQIGDSKLAALKRTPDQKGTAVAPIYQIIRQRDSVHFVGVEGYIPHLDLHGFSLLDCHT
jgi:hypothetical protein